MGGTMTRFAEWDEFFSFLKLSDRLWGIEVFSLGMNWTGGEVDHISPPRVEVKHEWSYAQL
jgi:hypothetical protein